MWKARSPFRRAGFLFFTKSSKLAVLSGFVFSLHLCYELLPERESIGLTSYPAFAASGSFPYSHPVDVAHNVNSDGYPPIPR